MEYGIDLLVAATLGGIVTYLVFERHCRGVYAASLENMLEASVNLDLATEILAQITELTENMERPNCDEGAEIGH